MTKLWSYAALAALMAGCAPAAPTTDQPSPAPEPTVVVAGVDQEFTLRPGQSATIAGEELTLRFAEVAGDSRCPSDVQCVWAGNAVVHAVLSKGGKGMGTELNTGVDPRSTPYLTYTVALVGLAPAPTSTRPVPAADYRATFVVRRR